VAGASGPSAGGSSSPGGAAPTGGTSADGGASANGGTSAASGGSKPLRAGLVLATLIGVAGVANLNLAVANVALPEIGKHFDAGQTMVDLIAVGYSLGLAASVLYLGAIGDRYGRKTLLVLGMALTIPASILAAIAPSAQVLFLARVFGGVAAGMAYPTTLALITALWSGPERTKSIALWSALGGGMSALGPLLAGALLEGFDWWSVFIVTAPLAAIALFAAWKFVPAHVNETTEPVDHLGGILSIALVGTLVLAINLAPEPGKGTTAIILGIVALAATGFFVLRQRRTDHPLYDLHIAARPTFWVAALAGIIVFGSLMGAMFIGQQFVQNVLGYSTFQAGLAILPGAIGMILVAPRSAALVEAKGSRFTLLVGFTSCLLAFLVMLIFWDEGASYLPVGLGFLFMGIGVGFAGTPASRSLTGSVPVKKAGMASGTADLQRDLGGAILQSVFGALLTAGYAKSFTEQIAASPQSQSISERVQNELTKSFSSAANTAQQYPEYARQIAGAARKSFLDGGDWTYAAGMIAVALGICVVFFLFPRHDTELALLDRFHAEDAG
jgi:MFS transporter, DHA2 family, multidrug resistance protein